MRQAWFLFVTLILLASVANAQTAMPARFTVKTAAGEIIVESFEGGSGDSRPAVLILSGSKGFGAPAYDEIGRQFHAAGLDVYLVHILSSSDVSAIAGAGSARARISYYAKRLPSWTLAVQGVVSHFSSEGHRAGRIGLLGISLGAEIAAKASADRDDIAALVLVDGGFPEGSLPSVHSLPPLQLIWGAEDRVFPASIAQALKQKARELGGPVSLNVYKGSQHDFFLKSEVSETQTAYRQAIGFLISALSRKS
jgi:dienelactone hydrolase